MKLAGAFDAITAMIRSPWQPTVEQVPVFTDVNSTVQLLGAVQQFFVNELTYNFVDPDVHSDVEVETYNEAELCWNHYLRKQEERETYRSRLG